MDLDKIDGFLKQFSVRHQNVLRNVALTQTQTLELAAAIAAVQHYESQSFSIVFVNPKSAGKDFRVKTSTRGHPTNFSHVQVSQGGLTWEIHINLMVKSAHDEGVYCVDVGIVRADSISKPTKGQRFEGVANADVFSLIEAKKLVVYPMLLAQFIGIVHEIAPRFLDMPGVTAVSPHFPPALVSLGYLTENSRRIVERYPRRGICIRIVANFDVRVARVGKVGESNFDRSGDDLWPPGLSVEDMASP